ncbi:MAG: phosphomannomutase/phosphoglucomutase [Spirochaetales bacterium]|nr:phosphomannomutase/phosphoglucomutase [Spirochaetales bacterium]MBO7348820.1 phosphomannomutase/phosphoglucomutase [Spirochaetales bacterium]MBP5757330.1 phosphomannomutase/phosphoglucomutase [Spirochaetales bacterium]
MGVFKAYDIRGVYNKDFNKDTAYKVGFFLPKLLPCKYVVVGRDIRLTSDEIFEYLCKGINDAGVDVWNIGLATTPMVYFATVYLKADASVQITASHNPKEYNGMKISRTNAIPVGGDTGLKDLEKMVNELKVEPVANKGKIIDKDIHDAYLSFQKKFLPDMSKLSITVDASNGMSNLYVKELFGNSAKYINDTLDGTFPGHEPNPLEVENCKQIMEAVKKNGSDCGVIYDGDADRVMFIDERGRFIQPDYVTAVIGKYYLAKEKGSVLVDIRTSRSTTEYLEKLGATDIYIWKVGHAFAKMKIREKHCVFGGELAGHYYFRDFYNCDSGILASLLVLQTVAQLKKEGKTLGQLVDEIVAYQNSGEINFKLEQKDQAIDALYSKYSKMNPTKIMDFDGYRIEFPTWWFSVRKSNTEPYLRIVAEAKTKAELDERLADLKAIIGQFS